MPHAFNQIWHPLGQCEHFSQVEPLEKLWFFVVHVCYGYQFYL
jgi:hypothetical protein